MSVRRIVAHEGVVLDENAWPDRIPAVRQLLTEGFPFAKGLTFLVGENGAGKSTLVEAIAGALGAHVEGGTSHHVGGPDRGTRTDGTGLPGRLRVVRSAGGSRETFFLRAETMHRFYDYLENSEKRESPWDVIHPVDYQFHYRSHGEGFLDLLSSRYVRSAGVVLMDEPESALSFDNCLVLAGALGRMVADGKQVLCATHSPLVTAVPGARILQVDENGLTPVAWEDLQIVKNWRFFLDAPERYLRRVL